MNKARSAASVIQALIAGEGSRRKAAAALGVTAARVGQLIVRHALQGWEQVIRFCSRPPWERLRRQAAAANAGAARRAADRRRAGLCPSCGGERDGTTAACTTCCKRMAGYQATYLRRRRERGLCERCPEPAVPGKSQCRGCLIRGAASQRERKRAQKSGRVKYYTTPR